MTAIPGGDAADQPLAVSATAPHSSADTGAAARDSARYVAGPTKLHGLGLVTLLSGAFLSVMSAIIVAVAIPSIQHEFGASPAISSLIAYYGLAYGCMLITGGRLGDLLGRRRMFTIGIAGFTAASLVCALAPSLAIVVAGRVGAGLAAAVMFPQVLSIIRVASENDAARAKGLAAFGVALGLSGSAGQLFGGLLISMDMFGLAWRWVFLLNIPIGIGACLLAPRVIPESRAPGAARLDLAGAALSAVAFGLLLFPLVEGRTRGWPLWGFAMMAAAVPVLVIFTRDQIGKARRGESPLVDLRLFARWSMAGGVIVAFLMHSTIVSMPFAQAMFMQVGLGFSALHAALIVAPVGVAFIAASILGERIVPRIGPQASMAIGACFTILGYVASVLIAYGVPAVSAWWLGAALGAIGFGQGLFMPLMLNAVLAGVPAHNAGSASGVVSTAQQVGGAFGVAIVGMLYFGALSSDDAAHAQGHATAFAHSLYYLIVAMGTCIAVLPLLFGRHRPTD